MIRQDRNIYTYRIWFNDEDLGTGDFQYRYILAIDEEDANKKLEEYNKWLKNNGYMQIQYYICIGIENNQPIIE